MAWLLWNNTEIICHINLYQVYKRCNYSQHKSKWLHLARHAEPDHQTGYTEPYQQTALQTRPLWPPPVPAAVRSILGYATTTNSTTPCRSDSETHLLGRSPMLFKAKTLWVTSVWAANVNATNAPALWHSNMSTLQSNPTCCHLSLYVYLHQKLLTGLLIFAVLIRSSTQVSRHLAYLRKPRVCRKSCISALCDCGELICHCLLASSQTLTP